MIVFIIAFVSVPLVTLTLVLYLAESRQKSFYWWWNGSRKAIHAPILKLLICAFLSAFVMLSIVPHIIFWLFGFRGFWDSRTGSYLIQNPFVRSRS